MLWKIGGLYMNVLEMIRILRDPYSDMPQDFCKEVADYIECSEMKLVVTSELFDRLKKDFDVLERRMAMRIVK